MSGENDPYINIRTRLFAILRKENRTSEENHEIVEIMEITAGNKINTQINKINAQMDGLRSDLQSRDAKIDAKMDAQYKVLNNKYNTLIALLSILIASGLFGFLFNAFQSSGN